MKSTLNLIASLILAASPPGSNAAEFRSQTATPDAQGTSTPRPAAPANALAGPSPESPAPLRHYVANPLIDVIADTPQDAGADNPPYPPSPWITGVNWAPKDTIIRKAKGSDNWPITWADDDCLYTAYGDGNGFSPRVPKKLSMGFARVSGGPEDFTGANVRSPSGEDLGDGKRGKKASGMLMVDGVLYMWVRNAANSQLAWSTDDANAWTWADWRFTTSFGCPTFLNFGKAYAGARDDYVYVYSHDSDTAYEPADRMVLARVPKTRVKDRGAYQFFRQIGHDGNPIWTEDIQRRGPVFSHAGHCYRSGISYNAPLKRYLWCQIHPQSKDSRGPRFQGGFGIYEAPQPWGPWTTVYFTNAWDVGPGETSCFPTKWISADGRTLHLVFSGDDHFSVRRVTLTTADES